jgi:hypothetical protein
MTRLRKMMLEELERRNYSEGTTRCYLRAVADCRGNPRRMGPILQRPSGKGRRDPSTRPLRGRPERRPPYSCLRRRGDS